MHQESYLSMLLTSSALIIKISAVVLVNTSIQPYDEAVAFRRCFLTLRQVLDAADVYATRLHTEGHSEDGLESGL